MANNNYSIFKIKFIKPVIFVLILFSPMLSGAAGFSHSIALGAPGLPLSSPRTVYVVTLSGEVDPGMAEFVDRAEQTVSGKPDALAVINIDTFGGRVDSALEIVDTLLKIPGNRSVAFVEKKAISAGALIALACGKLVMGPAATLGDCAPISYSNNGVEMLGEKFQSPLRAKFRALAMRNGYPEKLAEAMVSPDREILRVSEGGHQRFMDARDYNDLSDARKKKITDKKIIVEKGALLTMNADEAGALGFSRVTAVNIPDMLRQMGIGDYVLIPVDESWSEGLVRLIGRIAPILIMIGLAGVYLEMKAPGFGIPGVVGVSCLAAVFLNQYIAGLANYTDLLILIFGFVLMGLEVFVFPGFGLAGIAGILSVMAGMALSLQNFVIPDPAAPWEGRLLAHNVMVVAIAYIGAFLTAMVFLRYVLPGISKGRSGPLLMADLKQAHANSRETSQIHEGDRGVALSSLRPSGKAIIHDDLVDVVTEGEFVEKGTPIEVLAIRGNRIIVSMSTS